jgi:hypothetical protein
MVSLMGKLIKILAEVRDQHHREKVPTGWSMKLWGAIGQGPDSLLGPFRQISGLEVNGAFSTKLQKLVNSLTKNENMAEPLKEFCSQTAIVIEP